MRPTSGLTFGGRYQLSNRIAIGGMGEVWQATDHVIGRTVAIKILKDEYLGDPGFLERFRAEARHAALVNHEGIANVFDYGEEDGSAFLVMELVPGEALSTILERDRTLPTDKVLDIVAQTASALHAAHAAGLVHRDIKPGNLLITPDGRVKITDFGIARIADQVPLTATGQVMGTVQYLSPEQASGKPASPKTDVYSLGIVAYEALVGKRPFTGESQVAIAMAQINEAPPDLPASIAEPVRNLVYSCMAKDPADRPASAAHLARAATALRRGDVAGAVAAVPGVAGDAYYIPGLGAEQATMVLPTMTSGPEQTMRRNPWTWPLIALIGILTVVLVGTVIALFAQPSTPPDVSSESPSVSETPSTSPSPTDDRFEITLAMFEGKTEAQAQALIDELELEATFVTGSEPPNPDLAARVYSIEPQGLVSKGDHIVLRLYGEYPDPDQPLPMSAIDAGPYTVEQIIGIGWQQYQQAGCPPSTSLSGYRITVDGGSVVGSSSVGADVTQVQVKLREDAGETRITYVAVCGGTFTSPPSDPLVLTVAE